MAPFILKRLTAVAVAILLHADTVVSARASVFYPPVNVSQFVTAGQAAAAAPVQSVNGLTGAPVIPTMCRQSTVPGSPAAVSTTDGTASFTWPNATCAFATLPSCYTSLAASSGSYVFAAPVQTTLDSTHVVFVTQAALKLLTISLGALTVWTTPPAGTTMNITCTAPPQ